MTKIAIMGGRIIDSLNQVDHIGNVYLADGKIILITPEAISDFQPEKTIDAKDMIVCPGFVDLNASLFNANISSENFKINLQQAAAMGITDIGTYAFTPTHVLNGNEIAYFKEMSTKTLGARVHFIGALTQELAGQRLNELNMLHEVGCVAFSNGRKPIKNSLIQRRCYDYASMLGLKIFITLEDPYLASGYLHEGEISMRLGLLGIPPLSECLALARELLLIEETGVQAHLCRLSSGKAIELLMKKDSKINVTSDVAIHQLFLTEEAVRVDNGYCHVLPPFRSVWDREKLQEGLRKNLINAITSDHLLLAKQVKEVPFQDSEPGIASWPVFLPLLLKLVEEGKLTLSQAIGFVTHQPAKILGINAGHLQKNDWANITIFNPNASLGTKHPPFQDWPLKGRVLHTLIDGKIFVSIQHDS